MTDIEAEFEEHERFERADGAFEPTTSDFEATARVRDGGVDVSVTMPTLDAAVEGESVADVVEDGWFETFERRVANVDGVTLADDVTDPDVTRVGDEVTVEFRVTPRDGKAADDGLALVNFVEGTWFEGIVPGYDYVEQVQAMREQAAQNADETPL